MSKGAEFEFEVDDPHDDGTTEEVTAFFEEASVRFRITYWGGTVLARPHHDDIWEREILLPVEYKDRPAWVAAFRATEPANVWARLLLDPTPLAIWFGAWRMRVSNQVTELVCIVTDDEYGIEIGRAAGRFA